VEEPVGKMETSGPRHATSASAAAVPDESESHLQNSPRGIPGSWRPQSPISSPAEMEEFVMKYKTPGCTDK